MYKFYVYGEEFPYCLKQYSELDDFEKELVTREIFYKHVKSKTVFTQEYNKMEESQKIYYHKGDTVALFSFAISAFVYVCVRENHFLTTLNYGANVFWVTLCQIFQCFAYKNYSLATTPRYRVCHFAGDIWVILAKSNEIF